MSDYINWQDAKEYLSEDMVEFTDSGEIDIAKMTEFIATVEKQLNNRLRRYMQVPVGETESPEAFAVVEKVASMQSAAMYLRWTYSYEGVEDSTWWADRLDAMAEDQISLLTIGRSSPEDAEDAESPLQWAPTDGKLKDSTEPDALFGRDNVESGSGHW